MNQKGISKMWLIVGLVAVLLLGVLYVVGLQVRQSNPLLNVETKEYQDEQSGLSLQYPATWTITPHPETHGVWLVSPEKEQFTIIATRITASEAATAKSTRQNVPGGSPVTSNGFEGIKTSSPNSEVVYHLFKKIDADTFLAINTMIIVPSGQNMQNAETAFMALLPTISVGK